MKFIATRAPTFFGYIISVLTNVSYILFRANLIGACLGAKFGIQGIPEDWMSKVDGMDGIIKNAITCFS